MNELLELTHLTKTYDKQYFAVNDITLTIPKGRIIGLLGPNGSGKTTLIKMINGLLVPTAGTVRINGNEPGPLTKAHVAYLPDRGFLNEHQKVGQVLDYFADFYEDFSSEKALAMLKDLNIGPEARLNALSKGTREKVQLILIMSRQAELYILDEPIAGVDPAARDYILRTIISNYNPGATVLISTHLISDVESVLDEVIFLRFGRIVLYTSADNIREQHGKSVDAYFREVFAC